MLNPCIKHMMKDRKQLYDKAKRDQTPEAWRAYRNIRNKVTQALENAHNYRLSMSIIRHYVDQIQFQRNLGNTSRVYTKIAQELLP